MNLQELLELYFFKNKTTQITQTLGNPSSLVQMWGIAGSADAFILSIG